MKSRSRSKSVEVVDALHSHRNHSPHSPHSPQSTASAANTVLNKTTDTLISDGNLDEEICENIAKHVSRDRKKSGLKRSAVKLADWKHLSLDYQPIDWTKELPIKALNSLTVAEQESALIEDLLFVLIVRICFLYSLI